MNDMSKIWKLQTQISDDLTTQLLHNRGLVDKDAAQKFLEPKYEDLHDPFLFRDMRKAVERMQGEAGVESEPGQGSRFWIQLRGVES